MRADAPNWKKIKADFIAGVGVYELSKRYNVPIAEILIRAKAEGWQVRKTAEIVNLPVPARAAAGPPPSEEEQVQAKVDEAAQDIIKGHRLRTRELVETYQVLKSEFHEMLAHLASFLDAVELQKLKAEGNREQAVEILGKMLKAMGVKFTMYERLMSMHTMLVDVERTVWGLKETDDAPESIQWDDLQAKLNEPRRSRVLPESITQFERLS